MATTWSTVYDGTTCDTETQMPDLANGVSATDISHVQALRDALIAVEGHVATLRAGSGASGGPALLFADDTQFSESGTSYVTKKQFRVVSPTAYPFSGFHVVVGLWHDTATTCDCIVRVGDTEGSGGDTVTLQGTGTSEGIYSGDITFTGSDATVYTCWIRIKRAGGSGSVHVKYTDVYAVYA